MKRSTLTYLRTNGSLYLMLLPGLALLLVFNYLPMYGITMAFQMFKPTLGFFKSPWVGLLHFRHIAEDAMFFNAFKNTVVLGLETLAITFPAPIVLALLFNEMRHSAYKRLAQTISYMPNFLSTVIVVGIMRDMLSMSGGIVNDMIETLGMGRVDFFASARWFRTLYIGSGLWQGVGFSSIIYLAAIAGVSPELYEAAVLDGAGRFRQALYVTLPSILPTIVILLIFSVSGILGNDFAKILLIQTSATFSTSDVISTYVYRAGLLGANQSYAAAVGLFGGVIGLVLLSATNFIAKHTGETSLW